LTRTLLEKIGATHRRHTSEIGARHQRDSWESSTNGLPMVYRWSLDVPRINEKWPKNDPFIFKKWQFTEIKKRSFISVFRNQLPYRFLKKPKIGEPFIQIRGLRYKIWISCSLIEAHFWWNLNFKCEKMAIVTINFSKLYIWYCLLFSLNFSKL
jgi:hypothetical protein